MVLEHTLLPYQVVKDEEGEALPLYQRYFPILCLPPPRAEIRRCSYPAVSITILTELL